MNSNMLIAVLLLAPLVGFLINGFNWRSHNAILAGAIGTAAVAISFGCSLILFFSLKDLAPEARTIQANFFNWFAVGSLSIDAAFTIDQISGIMILIVTGVGSLIHLFSIGYMSHDKRPAKFFCYLNLFIFNMLLLVLGANVPVMFVGWEGVGLCSYLLIGFWFNDVEKANAGMKAFITNRVGDAGLLLGMFMLFGMFNTLEFAKINAAAGALPVETVMGPMTWAAFMLFIGACGKSAQIPLYIWLPDAMAGPTPVSALIHAATMVTAGVYMLCRLSFLFVHAPIALSTVAIIGAATAFFAATIGMTQWDIKKILAYSTVSQLGYMFIACGVGAFGAAMFHLMTHAFFKALMFLGSGSVIHGMHEEQDIRKMGGLKKYMPITHITFVCGWLAIIGTPLFSGFFSKDEILWNAFHSPLGSPWLWLVGACAAGFTAFYMTRLMCLTFWGKSRVPKDVHPHESPISMTLPLIILAVLSVIGGYIGVPHIIGHGFGIPNIWETWLEPVLAKIQVGEVAGAATVNFFGARIAEGSAEVIMMVLSVLIAATGATIAYVSYIIKPGVTDRFAAKIDWLYNVVYHKYFVDEFVFNMIINPIVEGSRGLWAYVDVNFIDKCTYWVGDFVKSTGDGSRSLQNGNLQMYALYMLLGLLLISTIILL
jgi:NADH-quinone oxidoreductase subunit L